ncbi:MAG: pseudouridine synthase [Verrucomicrobiae bacterium]|nr:pseudouridine synthase [Verrucomicrobiae bacterium]
MLIAFYKPYGVISQFTREVPGQRTLAEFGFPKRVYPIGRLDADSEGLLLLSDEPAWNSRLLDPRNSHPREYWAQVEGVPNRESLARLADGVLIASRITLPCRAWVLNPQPTVGVLTSTASAELVEEVCVVRSGNVVPCLPSRNPPIRYRKNVPTCWIAIELVEGKNRQVRRMTAAIGFPTLRLVRARIGQLWLGSLRPGEWRELTAVDRQLVAMR